MVKWKGKKLETCPELSTSGSSFAFLLEWAFGCTHGLSTGNRHAPHWSAKSLLGKPEVERPFPSQPLTPWMRRSSLPKTSWHWAADSDIHTTFLSDNPITSGRVHVHTRLESMMKTIPSGQEGNKGHKLHGHQAMILLTKEEVRSDMKQEPGGQRHHFPPIDGRCFKCQLAPPTSAHKKHCVAQVTPPGI